MKKAEGPQEQRRRGRGYSIQVSPDTLETVQRATEATGEAVEEFLARAAQAQAKRDKISLHMGLNPATGNKLEMEA